MGGLRVRVTALLILLPTCVGAGQDTALPSPAPSSGSTAADLPTLQEIADYWDVVFNGSAPFGVPPLNGTRSNQRTVNNSTVWDVSFDSYKDPVTDEPVRLAGVLAIPNNVTPPGPGGTFPGLVVTHSVGEGPPNGPRADDVEGMSTWFARKGYTALAFYMRGWGTSPLSAGAENDLFVDYLAADTEQPLDYRWTGMAVDCFQAGEFLAAQPEVWDPNALVYVGHSAGRFSTLAGAVFSSRFEVVSSSAPAGAWPDAGAWLDYAWGNGGFLSIRDWIMSQPDTDAARMTVERSLIFISMQHAIDNPFLIARNASWRLDGTAIFFYGGQADPAIPAWDVAANFTAANPTDPSLKAFHWSPTGGHGGPESWNRAQAWVAGHYPGIVRTPPIAKLSVSSIQGANVTFSAAGSQAWQYDWEFDAGEMSSSDDDIISWEYDFGDGTTMNWGPEVTHVYANAGTYEVTLTITGGGGLRDVDSLSVVVDQGSGNNTQLEVIANQPEIVPEGGTGTFLIRLTEAPEANLTVSIDYLSGDEDVFVAGGDTLLFTPGNWNTFQIVTLGATEDADKTSDSAVFEVTAPGLTPVSVDVKERDNQAEFTLTVGDATGAPGETVSVPITLTNHDAAPIASFSFTLSLGESELTNASATRGSDVPGPAWWDFADVSSGPGLQMIDAAEFVQPTDTIIQGVIADDAITIVVDALAGSYPITVMTAVINGSVTPMVQDGSVTIQGEQAVPSVSTWGLVVLAVVVTVVATIVLRRREWYQRAARKP